MVQYFPVITGSLTVNGNLSVSGNVAVTGSMSGTSSLAANAELLSGTGSVGFTTTGSFTVASSSLSSRTTQIESVYATTGSNSFRATQSITGSLTVTGQIIAQTINVQQVTSSIVYSSGSNVFGCDINSRQTFTGSFYQTGSVSAFYSCVGIGTNFPTKALEIFSNVSQDGIKISGASNPRLTIIDTTNSVQFDALTTDTEVVLRSDTNHPLHLSTNGTLRLNITNTGIACFACQVCAPQLILGGADQGYVLDVKRTSTGDANFDTIANFYKASTNATQLLIRAKNSLIDIAGSYVIGGGGPNTGLSFSVSPSGGSPTEAMRITSAGNIGINTTNFGEKLNIGCGAAIGFQNTCNCQKWHIQYNSNDGLNFVESTVADFRLFLKAGGNVGIGTSNPAAKLHTCTTWNANNLQAVFGNSNGSINSMTYDTVIIQQDDVTTLKLVERNIGSVDQVLTFTVGDSTARISTTCALPIQFFVAGNPSACGYNGLSGNAAMIINSNSKVEIGNNSASGEVLKVTGCSTLDNYISVYSGTIQMFLDADKTNNAGIVGTQSSHPLILRTAGTNKLTISTAGVLDFPGSNSTATSASDSMSFGISGASYAWIQTWASRPLRINELGNNVNAYGTNGYGLVNTTASDVRIKKNIVSIENALDKVNCLRGVYYEFDENNSMCMRVPSGKRRVGLIAQEVGCVLPEALLDSQDDSTPISLDYSGMIGLLTKAIQEQQCTINTLKTCIGIA